MSCWKRWAAFLCGGPYFSTAVLAAQTLLAAPGGDPVATELLEGICAGGLDCHARGDRGWRPVGRGGCHAPGCAGASGWELTGSKTFVPDGATADVILVPARTAAGISLFAVPGPAAGLVRVPLPAMDQTRKQARLDFTAAEGRRIGAGDGACGALSSAACGGPRPGWPRSRPAGRSGCWT